MAAPTDQLAQVKVDVRYIIRQLDPSPADPVAQKLLAILDAIDAANKELAARERFGDKP